MAVIHKDGVIIEFKNVVSYYCEEDDIHDHEDMGTYESFDIKIEVDGANVLSPILEDSVNPLPDGITFELCSGNILSLIHMVEEGLQTKDSQDIEFLEPDFSFELKPKLINEKESLYLFHIWINSGTWEGMYGGTDLGFRFSLKESELQTFLSELKSMWDNRKKTHYHVEDDK